MTATASIVIPAHNEESVIAGTLRMLLKDAAPGEFEIVVVCNGCEDSTADIATMTDPQIRVLELPQPSKIAALNAGDAATTRFPRVYLDADVTVTAADIRAVCAPLREGRALAAAPAVELGTSSCSWIVRAYFAVWQQLPDIRDGLAGRGVYALSAEGRSRFDQFPEVIADDRFVHRLFAPGQRITVTAARSVVQPPSDLASLLRRRIRVAQGNREQADQSEGSSSLSALVTLLRQEPRLLPQLLVFALVGLASRGLALARRGRREWGQDITSR